MLSRNLELGTEMRRDLVSCESSVVRDCICCFAFVEVSSVGETRYRYGLLVFVEEVSICSKEPPYLANIKSRKYFIIHRVSAVVDSPGSSPCNPSENFRKSINLSSPLPCHSPRFCHPRFNSV